MPMSSDNVILTVVACYNLVPQDILDYSFTGTTKTEDNEKLIKISINSLLWFNLFNYYIIIWKQNKN